MFRNAGRAHDVLTARMIGTMTWVKTPTLVCQWSDYGQ